MRTKILFVIQRIGYGGASKIMAFLANGFSREGYQICIAAYEGTQSSQVLDPGIVRLAAPRFGMSTFALRRLLQLAYLRKATRELNPDAVIAFLYNPSILSILAAAGTPVPVIISERGDPYASLGWYGKLRDFLFNHADGAVFQTEQAKSYYGRRIQAKGTVIKNPLPAARIPPRWTGAKEDLIVNVARFELKQKRQDVLVKAFRQLAGRHPNIRLALFGSGEDESEIKKLIMEQGLEGRVLCPGVSRDIYESIRRARLFVLSSDYEGIPNALIEAMSVGMPCISTDYSPGGAADLIRHRENGILVRPGNVDELARAMEFIIDHPREADEMGAKATAITHALDPEIIFDQWKVYVNKIIHAKSADKRHDNQG